MVSSYGLLLRDETAYFGTWLNSLAIIYFRMSSFVPSRDSELRSTSYFVWKQAFNFDSADEKTILAYSNEETNSCKNMRIARGGSIDGSIFRVYCLSSMSTTAGLTPTSDIGNENRISVIDNNIDQIHIEIYIVDSCSAIYGARNNIFNNSLSY